MSDIKRKLWVVEVWCPGWEPQEGLAYYNREAARKRTQEVRRISPGDRFRVVRYVPARTTR